MKTTDTSDTRELRTLSETSIVGAPAAGTQFIGRADLPEGWYTAAWCPTVFPWVDCGGAVMLTGARSIVLQDKGPARYWPGGKLRTFRLWSTDPDRWNIYLTRCDK